MVLIPNIGKTVVIGCSLSSPLSVQTPVSRKMYFSQALHVHLASIGNLCTGRRLDRGGLELHLLTRGANTEHIGHLTRRSWATGAGFCSSSRQTAIRKTIDRLLVSTVMVGSNEFERRHDVVFGVLVHMWQTSEVLGVVALLFA